jgi:hypothetical protein
MSMGNGLMVGSRVTAFSRVSDETWTGTVTAINTADSSQNNGDMWNSYGVMDTMTLSSSYVFDVELDSVEGLLLGLISDDQFKRCFDAAAEKGIALEINPNMFALSANRPLEAIYNDPFVRMYRIAKACGCRFTFGADAHNASSHANFHMAYVLAAILDIQQEDLHPLAR